jgi:hypothetical protein
MTFLKKTPLVKHSQFTIQEFTIQNFTIKKRCTCVAIHHSPFKNSQLKSAAHALPIDNAQSKQITSTA